MPVDGLGRGRIWARLGKTSLLWSSTSCSCCSPDWELAGPWSDGGTVGAGSLDADSVDAARSEVLGITGGGADREVVLAVRVLRERSGLELTEAYRTVTAWLADEGRQAPDVR